MWDTLSLPWQTCLELLWESFCDNCYPIGAVVTDSMGGILSRGRNRVYPKEYWSGPMPGVDNAHAEVEALLSLDYAGIDPHTCMLYTTMEPCPMCLGMFYMSGLRTLHYASRDVYAGSVDMLGKTFYLRQKQIRVNGPSAELETILVGIIMAQEYMRHCGVLPQHSYFQRYREILPEGLRLGEALYRSGLLETLKKRSTSASETFERLSAFSLLEETAG